MKTSHYTPLVGLLLLTWSSCQASVLSRRGLPTKLPSLIKPKVLKPEKPDAEAAAACKQLEPQDKVSYEGDKPYTAVLERFMVSSGQYPACVFTPTLPSEISSAIKLIGDKKIHFAVSSGENSSNQGFSSTTGIHISMTGFAKVTLSEDKKYVDIGSGNLWNQVYDALEGSGVNVLGARVSNIGVGGLILGGGGYSWKTNQYGLTIDTLIQAKVILPNGDDIVVSSSSHPGLLFALKGGGNQFGIVYSFRLLTVPQGSQVYGGLRTYVGQADAFMKAVDTFTKTNKDPKAQIVPTFNNIYGSTAFALMGFYDGPDPGTAFAAFDKLRTFQNGWKARTFSDLVNSQKAAGSKGYRGTFQTLSLQRYSPAILQQTLNQTDFWGKQKGRSGNFIFYDVQPFLKYGDKVPLEADPKDVDDSAYPHGNSPLPFNLYFCWSKEQDDEFYQDAIRESAKVITNLAVSEGQDLSQLALYPNYAQEGTSARQLFGDDNAAKLREMKAKYDPDNVMGLTTYYSFK